MPFVQPACCDATSLAVEPLNDVASKSPRDL
jgi:hypothetical protein